MLPYANSVEYEFSTGARMKEGQYDGLPSDSPLLVRRQVRSLNLPIKSHVHRWSTLKGTRFQLGLATVGNWGKLKRETHTWFYRWVLWDYTNSHSRIFASMMGVENERVLRGNPTDAAVMPATFSSKYNHSPRALFVASSSRTSPSISQVPQLQNSSYAWLLIFLAIHWAVWSLLRHIGRPACREQ